LTHVQIHQDAYFGDAFGVMEPVWHLILRNLQIIDGAEYSQYGVSWKPILYQLPYTTLFYAASTLIITIVIIAADKTIRALRAKQKRKAT